MLHLPQLSSGAREVPLSLINERDRVYVAVVDPAALPTGRTVSYYFSLESPDGPVCSQLYQMTPSRHWAAAASSNGPPAGLEGSGTGSSSDPS